MPQCANAIDTHNLLAHHHDDGSGSKHSFFSLRLDFIVIVNARIAFAHGMANTKT